MVDIRKEVMTEYFSCGESNSTHVYVTCTEPLVLEWAAREIKRLVPRSKLNHELKLPDGDLYEIDIKDVKDNRYHLGTRMAFWLFRELCHMGWEPYSRGYVLKAESLPPIPGL